MHAGAVVIARGNAGHDAGHVFRLARVRAGGVDGLTAVRAA